MSRGAAALTAIMVACSLPAESSGAERAGPTTLSDLLKAQTQAFSEAGQKGDKATMARLLDSQVVFTNENGAIVTKDDILASAAPATGDPRIEVTEWSLTRQGNVATATFVDVLTQKIAGKTLLYRYHSTEVWARRASGWKMIASQTMVVPQDPPAITLTSAQLDEYVGVYRLAQGFEVKILRVAGQLESNTNDGPLKPLQVELRDVLFTPGLAPGRRIFQRDQSGKIFGYIARRDGNDLLFRKVG